MVMTTPKMLIMVFVINTLFFSASAVYSDLSWTESEYDLEAEQMRQHMEDFRTDFGVELPDAEAYTQSTSYGDEKGSQLTMWTILKDGLLPIPIPSGLNIVEETVLSIMNIFKTFFQLTLLWLVVAVFKNKRTE